jgi:hypothetical protein
MVQLAASPDPLACGSWDGQEAGPEVAGKQAALLCSPDFSVLLLSMAPQFSV